jgi:hypothetical protein
MQPALMVRICVSNAQCFIQSSEDNMAWAIGGMIVGVVIGAIGCLTYLLAKLTGESWWRIWKP